MSNKYIFIILFALFCSKLFSEEEPKKIIVIEENLELEKVDDDKINSVVEENYNSKTRKNENLIVIDDIPKEFNDWYGILSSDKGGLGWLMWGSTNEEFATNLLKTTNFSTRSPLIFKLTSTILMSRAQKPREKNTEEVNNDLNEDDKLKYLKEKIKILGSIGDTENIKKLIDNVPLEIKDDEFYNLIFDLRQSDKDIPYICSELLKKKFNVKADVEKRKTLIACIIAEGKYSQAELALDLLENDSVESASYIKTVRRFLDEPLVKNLLLDEKKLKNKNLRIISLSDYKIAKLVFAEDSLTLNKIIYDMKLYTLKEQIESLEKLVSNGLYDPIILKTAYANYFLKIKDNVNPENFIQSESENSLDVRVSLFYLVNNTISDIDRARVLNLLWLKAKEIDIQKAIYSITNSSINSLTPKRELSWFIYPITRALISNQQFEQAKNWLFFINNDLKDRAILDLNFCKMLLLLYIADKDLKNSEFEIPDINFLLDLLDNSLEVKKESIFSIMITLKALNFEVSSNFWHKYYINQSEIISSSYDINKGYLFLALDEALKKRNLAETIFIIIDLLNSSNQKNFNSYYLYKSIYSLNNIGLRQYARDLGLEINLGI